jgi:hypothetical protein
MSRSLLRIVKTIKSSLTVVTCAISILYSSTAFAGAWLVEKGRQHHYNALHYYETSVFTNDKGVSISTDLYRKYGSINLFEYGFSDSVTLGAKYGYIYASQSGNTDKGLTDPELLARIQLWKDEKSIFSLQPTIKIPLSESTTDRPFSTGKLDTEIRLLWATSISEERKPFINFEAAYNIRGGSSNPDEVKIDAAGGINLSTELMAVAQLFSTISAGHEAISIANRNPGDFYTQKLEFSLVRQIKKNMSIQLGIYGETFNENSSRGSGVFISYWSQF